MKKIKVAIIHHSIAPHRISLFNRVAKNKNINLKVYFLNEIASNRRWKFDLYKEKINFDYKVLSSFKIIFPFFSSTEYSINFSIFSELKKEKFDVIVCAGWVDFASQILPFLKNLFDYKYILWAGSTENEPSLQRKLFLPLVKSIIKKSDSLISYGTKSKRYLSSLKNSSKDIFPVFNAVDESLFINKNELLTTNKRNKIKKIYGIKQNQKVVLYVGQFIERKNVETLIKAISKLEKKKVFLILQGYGKLKSSYISLANKMNINLKILPHTETSSLPIIYAISDLFVLPSKEEVWGLVVNEAMSCGLPVIVSNTSGCVPDLIEEGKNGFSFKPNNASDLSKKINIILKNNKTMINMGNESLKIIKKKNIQSASRVFIKAIISAVK